MPHRWDGATLVAATDAEQTVDELLDAIEQGTLVSPASGRRRRRAPWTRCSRPRTAWPATRMTAAVARTSATGRSSSTRPSRPTASPSRRGPKVIDAARQLADLTDDEASTSSDIIGAAQELRSIVRQYVS